MTGAKVIAISWLTFVMFILTFAFLSFSYMGDCLAGQECRRAPWLSPLIVGIGIAVWLGGLSLVLRRKKN